MAPQLSDYKHEKILALLLTAKLTRELARKAEFSERTVRRIIRANFRRFGNTRPPRNRTGRSSSIAPCMLDGLCRKLSNEPWLHREEMAASLRDEWKKRELCSAAGAEVLFLPPYSPDLKPIEEHFGEVKGLMRKEWYVCLR